MTRIKLFEEFTKVQRQEFVDKELSYLKKYNFNKEQMESVEKISNYDISNFVCDIKTYGITLYPDDKFREILAELNLNSDIEYDLSVTEDRLNEINLFFELPEILRGLGLGYKIYKLIIQKFDFITSDYRAKKEAYNIWYKLMVDADYYCFTSKICSGVIVKNISDEKLTDILVKIKEKVKEKYNINFEDLILDDELKEKYSVLCS